ncbi:NAD(P)-dependent alcohol dehydrogenase [Nonomuraea sp. NN258]|uniref:NAD(P)-dependent alcohol dehydrogenase n=1 Tax=Nonomuraea antri TaxID=2730852 RepID=UPI00156848D7|nr:NAD(P)-dependent alcohol dehydrogenase [Nonomuraea antri]NRQ33577.1 NAD(P)-dependent alcohol dehydrogenase [Nonomuraea antri]
MKVFTQRTYGGPEVLELREVERPAPARGEVLVRVRATSVQPYDWHLLRGQPYAARLTGGGGGLGLRRPRIAVLGADVAGEVERVGPGVTGFEPGDEVFALAKQGGFGEYVCLPQDALVRKPRTLTFEQAAAIPLAAGTALLALREEGRVSAGQRVLVNGASGGVGTFAVQLAKAFGAHVTGVCSGRNAGLVRSLGADEVIDYTKQDFTREGDRYDVLVDAAGGHRGSACRRVLTSEGAHVLIGGPAGRWLQPMGAIMATLVTGRFAAQRTCLADIVRHPHPGQLLTTLAGLADEGRLMPVIDRVYPFDEIPDAVRYQELGHAAGKVVVTVGG